MFWRTLNDQEIKIYSQKTSKTEICKNNLMVSCYLNNYSNYLLFLPFVE